MALNSQPDSSYEEAVCVKDQKSRANYEGNTALSSYLSTNQLYCKSNELIQSLNSEIKDQL